MQKFAEVRTPDAAHDLSNNDLCNAAAPRATRPMGDNGGARRDLSCCPWLLLWSLGALLLLRGSLLLPGSSLLLRADTPVQQVDARGLKNASLICGLNPFDENRPASAALGSDRAAGMPPHALEY